jgi:hypothetical protein
MAESIHAAAAHKDLQISGRLAQQVIAAYDAQVAEMSQRVLEGVNAQMASIPIPRVEIFRPTLAPVVAGIEIPYHPQPTPAPVGEMAVAPHPQPSVPTREQDRVEQKLLVGSAHYILGPFGSDSDLGRHGQKIASRGGKNAKKNEPWWL